MEVMSIISWLDLVVNMKIQQDMKEFFKMGF